MGKRKAAVAKHESEEIDDPEAEGSDDSLNQNATKTKGKKSTPKKSKPATPKAKPAPKAAASKTKSKGKAKVPSDDEEEEEEDNEEVENAEDEEEDEEGEEDEDEEDEEGEEGEESEEEGGDQKFPRGTFVAAKADLQNGGGIVNKTACIWQVDDSTLLQKFAPQEDDKGNVVYSATPVYTGWGVRKRSDYEEVKVKNESGAGNKFKKVSLIVVEASTE